MKNRSIFTRIGALMMVLCMVASFGFVASAATVADATINMDAECSITIYKYDRTNATKDGVFNDSYVSTGRADSDFQNAMTDVIRKGDTDNTTAHHNGDTSKGYAIKGVEFSYAKVADIVTYTESVNDGDDNYNMTMVLYGFNKTKAADLLSAIGLGNGVNRYESADSTDKLDGANNYYYTSDTLNTALATALTNDPTAVKNALEAYIAAIRGNDASVGGVMPLTDENGKSTVSGLKVGLYIIVETAVPEMVTATVAPFWLSLPSTDNNGTNWTEGGHNWMYDVTLYPKNETGIVELEKFVRESKEDTGTHGDSGYGEKYITDGWAHNATGSSSDVMEYQILSNLPTITSNATAISEYTFHDVLSEGLSYVKNDIKLEWFTDKACATTPVATWDEASGKFAVTYSADNQEMTIKMTENGLADINKSAATANNVNNTATVKYAGFSNYTVRVTYSAKINADATFVYGANGNDNVASLTWRRTSSEHYDMLWDDAHVYSFGIDLTKLFSDVEQNAAAEKDATSGESMFDHVKFIIQNETDGYFVQAELNKTEGVYYVTGHTTEEDEATIFVPVTAYPGTEKAAHGKVIVKGLEDDTYIITETETADKYSLLRDNIKVVITASEDDTRPCDVYDVEAKLGVYQNDGRYYWSEGEPNIPLANMPQKQLAHVMLTGSATVDGNAVAMKNDTDPTTGEETDSETALVPLRITNTRKSDFPQTGEFSTLLVTTGGTLAVLMGAFFIFFVAFKRKNEEQAA